MKADPDEDEGLRARDRSLPPPRTVQTIRASFRLLNVRMYPTAASRGPLEVAPGIHRKEMFLWRPN